MGVIEAAKQFVVQGLTTEEEAAKRAAVESNNFNKAVAAGDFWRTAQDQLWAHDSDILSVKLRELGVDQDLPGMEDLVGVSTWKQVTTLYEAFTVEPPRKWRHGSPFLVFKFNDLPERISGFLLLQYNEEFQARHMFLAVHGQRTAAKAEAGYYLLQNALLQNKDLHNCVFIVDDVFWVLKAQITQKRYGLNTLPICASYHTDKITSSGRNWQAFPYTPRFFYSDTSPADAISQACLGKGYVCLPLDRAAYTQQSKPNRTMLKLAAIRKLGVPWKTALADVLDNTNMLQARAIGQRMNIPQDKIRVFCETNKIKPQIAEQLLAESIITPVGQISATQCVFEKDGRWINGQGRHVAEGTVRITDVFQNDNGEQTYRGYAQIQEQRIDFTERAKIIERMGLLAYVRYKAGQRGILFIFDKRWNSRSLMLAMQIERPRFVQVSDKIGWCDETAEFRFPNYAITNSGDVVSKEYVGDKHKPFPEPTVAAPLSITNILTPAHEHAAIWSGIAAIISNIVAPISNKNFVSVAVPSENYVDILARVGQQLDCPYRKLVGLSGVIKIANTVQWPHVLDAPYDRKRLIATITRHQQSPILLKTYYATAVAAVTYGWNALHTPLIIGHEDLTFLPYLLPAYVQRVLRKRMTLAAGKNFMRAVLHDLHTWLQETYGATFNLPQANENLWTPEDTPNLLMRFLAAEIENGEIDVLPRPRNKEQPQNYVLKNDKFWWINEQILNRRFSETCGLTPNWTFVRTALDTMNVFLGQNTIQGAAGFNVNSEWASSFAFRENRKIG